MYFNLTWDAGLANVRSYISRIWPGGANNVVLVLTEISFSTVRAIGKIGDGGETV